MSASPDFKIFRNGNYIGCVKNPIYALRMFFDDWDGWDIRFKEHTKKSIIWDSSDVRILFARDGEVNYDSALLRIYNKLNPIVVERIRDL